MNLTGGGAFYSQAPKSCLENIGVNKGVNEVPEPSYSSEARVASRLEKEIEINKKLDSRIQVFENDEVCHSERSEESQSLANLVEKKCFNSFPLSEGRGRNCANECERTISGEGLVKESQNRVDMLDLAILRRYTPQKDNSCYPHPIGGRVPKAGEGLREEEILRPSAEILSATSTINTQNDKNRCHCGFDPQSQSQSQKMDCPLTPTPSPNGRRGRKSAFTLAEILVTLGVIGIIAAMTLPMLARNYQWFIRQQQFKKAYAALNIAVQKTQIDLGEGVRCYNFSSEKYDRVMTDCKYFYFELSKNLSVLKTCERTPWEKGCFATNMKDPKAVYIDTQGGSDASDRLEAKKYFENSCPGFGQATINKYATVYLVNSGYSLMPYYEGQVPIFIMDINGVQNPNKWGHDIFVFEFYKLRPADSVFTVRPSSRCHVVDKGGYYATTFMEYLYGQNAEL